MLTSFFCWLVLVAAAQFFFLDSPMGRRLQERVEARRRTRAQRPSRAELIRRLVARPRNARWLFMECRRLAFAGAQWSVIVEDLNPKRDLAVAAALRRIQAVYVGRPLRGLELIADSCRRALDANADATAFDALSLAVRRAPSLPVLRL